MLKSPEANAAVAEAEAANARAEARDLPCADRIDLAGCELRGEPGRRLGLADCVGLTWARRPATMARDQRRTLEHGATRHVGARHARGGFVAAAQPWHRPLRG